MTLQIVFLVLGFACMAAALVLLVKPWWVAAVPAFAGMLLLHLSTAIFVKREALIFWGAAATVVVMIRYLAPGGGDNGGGGITGNLYVAGGAVVGALLGIVTNPAVIVLGAIAGAVLGALAFSRTPRGRWRKLRGPALIQWFCARCLPAIVAVAIMGISVEGFIFEPA